MNELDLLREYIRTCLAMREAQKHNADARFYIGLIVRKGELEKQWEEMSGTEGSIYHTPDNILAVIGNPPPAPALEQPDGFGQATDKLDEIMGESVDN